MSAVPPLVSVPLYSPPSGKSELMYAPLNPVSPRLSTGWPGATLCPEVWIGRSNLAVPPTSASVGWVSTPEEGSTRALSSKVTTPGPGVFEYARLVRLPSRRPNAFINIWDDWFTAVSRSTLPPFATVRADSRAAPSLRPSPVLRVRVPLTSTAASSAPPALMFIAPLSCTPSVVRIPPPLMFIVAPEVMVVDCPTAPTHHRPAWFGAVGLTISSPNIGAVIKNSACDPPPYSPWVNATR